MLNYSFSPMSSFGVSKTPKVYVPQRFERVELDQFVVMPNHVHGIIVITSANVGAIPRL